MATRERPRLVGTDDGCTVRGLKGTDATEERLTYLLREIGKSGSLRAAARSIGLDPGNASRLLRTAERSRGTMLIQARAGGRGGGLTALTAAGRRVARRRISPSLRLNVRWSCRLLGRPSTDRPVRVWVPQANVEAQVASPVPRRFEQIGTGGESGDWALEIPPTAVTLLEARRALPRVSARNLWPARVLSIGPPERWGLRAIGVGVGSLELTAALTSVAVRDLRLKAGSKVVVQVKATALRLVQVQAGGREGDARSPTRPPAKD